MSFSPPLTPSEINQAFDNRYRTIEMVDVGGQGAVFKATTETSETALKIYFDDHVEERAAREVDALKRIHGETIVKLLDAGYCHIRNNRCMYIATAFIRGRTVASVLANKKLDIPEIARLGRDVALAIESMWHYRVVHRDIKPNNVMLAEDGRAVLIDLGIARHLTLGTLTTSGTVWGTEGYFSPEQAKGEQLTCKSDIFALGILLQECILGRHPTGHRQGPLMQGGVRTIGLRQDIPAPIIALVDSMLHKSAAYRPFPSAVASTLTEYI